MKLTPFLILFFCFSLSAQINFEKPDWADAVDKARKDKKLIMVYMNTEWCEPCLEMELNVFNDEEVGTRYSKSFINVPFDAELYPGAELAERYQVEIFPTFLFLNEYGELIHRGCGYMEPGGLQLMATDALGTSNLKTVRQQFENGDRSEALVIAYTELLESACMDKGPFVKAYFKDLPHDLWVSPATWAMINLNVTDPNSDEFEFLTTYHDRFALKFGKDTIDSKIYSVLLDQFVQIYEGEDLTLFALQTLRRMLEPLDFKGKDRLRYMIEVEYYEMVRDWENYGLSVKKVVEDQKITDENLLNEFAWKFYLYVANPELISLAKDWMSACVVTTQNASTLDTYASLLYKTGEKKEAIKWEQKAIEQAKTDMEDMLHYQLQLDRFEKGL